MSIAEYIADHKSTKTCKEGLIIFKEYKIERRWGGLKTVFHELPKADDEHHVLVMNFNGIHPSIATVLMRGDQNIDNAMKTNELNKYLFVFVKTKPQLLCVSSPERGYQLGDGHTIHADIDVTYQVNNAKEFWLNADDPLAMLERAIINEAREYFFSITSDYLIMKPGDIKGSLELHIHENSIKDSEIKKIKGYLEIGIKERCATSGIEILNVYADVQLSQKLSDNLKELHDKIYNQGGMLAKEYELKIKSYELNQILLYRKNIDDKIEYDSTFHPYKLKNIIIALGIGLLENFYNLPWIDAMQKVHNEINKRRNSYLSDYKVAKIEGIQKLIKQAEETGLEDVYIDELKSKLFKTMNNDQEYDSPLFTDKQFLQLFMAQQIEFDESNNKARNS